MSTAAMLGNYLFLQPLIEQRLREQLPPNTPVEGIEQLSQADFAELRPVVVYVMWAGDKFDETESGRARNGASQMVFQRWMVVLNINNIDLVNKDARNEQAGALLSQIHKALAGWTPAGLARAFVRSGATAPSYKPTGGMFPLGFAIQLTL